MRKRWTWAIGIVTALLVLAVSVAFLVDEPLRRTIERQMNARLKGYTAHIGHLDFHPIGFAIDLRDVVLVQDAHPDPPVLKIRRLSASVQWSAIVHRRVVADFELVAPAVYVDRTHLVKELEDPTPIEQHGWQEALEAIYPLKINEFVIHDGWFSYFDAGQARPLVLSNVEAVLNDIRTVRSEPDVYPSPVSLRAVVFDDGRLAVDGRADFLRVPYAGVKGRIGLEHMGLEILRPILTRWGVTLAAGTIGGRGNVEYAPETKVLDLEEVTLDGLRADYAYRARTAAPVKEAVRTTARAAEEVSNKPGVLLKARSIHAAGATIGFVNEQAQPHYRVSLDNAELTVDNFTNQRTEGTATARLTGRFMGSGATKVTATFRPEVSGPDFDLDVRIENTDMQRMNDLLRAHAKLDVTSGVFSVFSELHVKSGRVTGYVKPLFRDLEVYGAGQDEDKPLGQRLKEKAVDVIGKVLRNRPRAEVATVAPIEGPLANPRASTWETLIGLVENAFFRAILPGFEQERRAVRR